MSGTAHRPLPWEHVLWSGRPVRIGRRVRGERYMLTDVRLIRTAGASLDELVLHDIGDIERTESRLDRLLGTSTVVVRARRQGLQPMALVGIRRGAPLAALLELLSGDPHTPADVDAVRSALAWNPRPPLPGFRQAIAVVAALLVTMSALVIGLHGPAAPVAYAAGDAIAPGGVKRSRSEIVQFMEREVLPWARPTLGRIKGGPDRITCQTCHGGHPEGRDWEMPSVSALPLPVVRERGLEMYNGSLDAQLRNAIYGYVAGSDNQAKAAYMREIVVPGMARLLGRPAYDFTQTYEYNRARHAIGCYHCHRVK